MLMRKIQLFIMACVLSIICFVELSISADRLVPSVYATINLAVAAAAPYDVIKVNDGTYNESVTVSKDHLTIQSVNGASSTTVNGGGNWPFSVTAAYVTISGFTVKGAWGAGIQISSTNHATISNNIMKENYYGFQLFYSSNSTISNNIMTLNTDYGTISDGSSNNLFLDNTITDNGDDQYDDGILEEATSSNKYRGNQIENNRRYGIMITASSTPDLGTEGDPGRNTIRNNGGYEVANYTSNTINAYNNFWDVADIDANIYDDNESSYGAVLFDPWLTSDQSLPVELTTFTASYAAGAVLLKWVTESEVDNLGFILERSEGNAELWRVIASYRTHAGLKGQSNSSRRTDYTFTDIAVVTGKGYYYRLSDVDVGGGITVHAPVFVELTETSNALPKETLLERAYPNPFNPQTYITYHLAENTEVKITVIDMLGRSVKGLYEGNQPVGSYHIYWNGTDENGMKASSGNYIIRMQTENAIQIQKVLFMK